MKKETREWKQQIYIWLMLELLLLRSKGHWTLIVFQITTSDFRVVSLAATISRQNGQTVDVPAAINGVVNLIFAWTGFYF